jgi:4-hydroxyphenylpyruvate dioxygenase-like putative hemolysin
MDNDQPTLFALLIVVGLEEGKCLCGVNVSWSDHLSLAVQRSKFGNTTKFYRTRSEFNVKIYYDNKITGPVPLWRGKATIAFLKLKVLLSTPALL